YRGTTFINQGVLTIQNGQALGAGGTPEVQTVTLTGATAGSTFFTLTFNGQTTQPIAYSGTAAADTAAIQAALNALTSVGGAADGAAPSVPTQWCQVGPAPTANGQTPATQNTPSRVTEAVPDPGDSHFIYIETAGGGAMKNIDGGKSWRPLLDALP